LKTPVFGIESTLFNNNLRDFNLCRDIFRAMNSGKKIQNLLSRKGGKIRILIFLINKIGEALHLTYSFA